MVVGLTNIELVNLLGIFVTVVTTLPEFLVAEDVKVVPLIFFIIEVPLAVATLRIMAIDLRLLLLRRRLLLLLFID